MACPYHQHGMPKRGGGPGATVEGLRRLQDDLDLGESRLERERRG
jgi:hypothetical protein